MSGRNLTDEDAKFLISVEESKKNQELCIKKQTDAALHEFRIKHELISRESYFQELDAEKIHGKGKIKSSAPQTESVINTKRNLLGITPKSNK